MVTCNSTPRVGLVGAGYFSQFHIRAWKQCGASVVAICDKDRARARSQAARFEIADEYDDAVKMLKEGSLDVIDIAVPPDHQADVVSGAIEARVATICQKPFLATYQAAHTLAHRAATAGVPLIIHENFRFMPWFREAKRLIASGSLGHVHGMLFRLRPGDGQGVHAYLDRQPYFQKMRRFLVVETAIHYIDTFRYLLGDVVAVSARLRRVNRSIAGEDAGIVVFEFVSGATAILDANRCNDHVAENARRTMGEMWLEGDAGCLRLDGDARLWWKPHQKPEQAHSYPSGSSDPMDFGGGACTALQQSALSALFKGEKPENTAIEYLENIRIQEAIYCSHETGRRVEMNTFVPPSEQLVPTLSFQATKEAS
jgi:predicted dehydrogenase